MNCSTTHPRKLWITLIAFRWALWSLIKPVREIAVLSTILKDRDAIDRVRRSRHQIRCPVGSQARGRVEVDCESIGVAIVVSRTSHGNHFRHAGAWQSDKTQNDRYHNEVFHGCLTFSTLQAPRRSPKNYPIAATFHTNCRETPGHCLSADFSRRTRISRELG